MKVKDLLSELTKLNPEAIVMMPDMGVGGSVEVEKIEVVNDLWIDLIGPEI